MLSDVIIIIIIIILYLPSDFRVALTANVSEHYNNTTAQTRPQHRELHALLFIMSECVCAGDGAYGQRQHILLSYFKTLTVGPVWDSNLRPPAQ